MKLRLFLIGMIVFGMTTVGLWGAVGHMSTNYGVTISKDLGELSEMETFQSETEEMKEVFKNPWASVPIIGQIYTIATAGFQAIQKLLSIVDTIFNTIATIGGLIPPLPDFILNTLKAVFMVFFTFTFANALLNRDV